MSLRDRLRGRKYQETKFEPVEPGQFDPKYSTELNPDEQKANSIRMKEVLAHHDEEPIEFIPLSLEKLIETQGSLVESSPKLIDGLLQGLRIRAREKLVGGLDVIVRDYQPQELVAVVGSALKSQKPQAYQVLIFHDLTQNKEQMTPRQLETLEEFFDRPSAYQLSILACIPTHEEQNITNQLNLKMFISNSKTSRGPKFYPIGSIHSPYKKPKAQE